MSQIRGRMTEGNIYKQIILFSIPLLLGNFFQLMYNTIDSVVVGNAVGSQALAAVGISTPIINLLVAFFIGLSTGAGVVVSRGFGGGRLDEVHRSVHTFILFSILFGILLTAVGVFGSRTILLWMGTEEAVLPQALSYLRIYFLGSVFLTVYNAGTGILQAAGDSKTPLYFLIATSILNIILDVLFVAVIRMGVAGAALATIICEAVSMILILRALTKGARDIRLSFSELKIDPELLSRIIRIGIPAGLQGMIVSISNVIVMSYISGFGASSVAGFTSANKFDNFLGLPVNSFALAVTTFTGQNLGAKQYERVRQGVRAGLILSCATVISAGIIVFIFAPQCIAFFSQEPEVMDAGARCIRAMCPFYTALAFHQVLSGALRASGRSSIPMITSIVAFVVLRQIYLLIALRLHSTITVVAYGYSFTWIAAALFTSAYYVFSHWLAREEKKASA